MSRSRIEDQLARGGRGFFQTVGDSMEPLLHNRRSTVVIEPKTRRLRRWEVALFRRPDGQYVLHRVVRVVEGGYLVCGDNRDCPERVPEDWVLGVMAGFFTDEQNRYCSCSSPPMALYLRRLKWRRRFRRLRRSLARALRRLFR